MTGESWAYREKRAAAMAMLRVSTKHLSAYARAAADTFAAGSDEAYACGCLADTVDGWSRAYWLRLVDVELAEAIDESAGRAADAMLSRDNQ